MKENPEYHPEGDALYHSLQVFELARAELPYDEEFLLAALLHDVGKAIDRQRPRGRRPGSAGRPHHAADGLADRASHGRPGSVWTAAWVPAPGDGWRRRKISRS